MKLYTIKPLKWSLNTGKGYTIYTAKLSVGEYKINAYEGSPITWSFRFDTYYDENKFESKSIEAAKKAAREHWKERITELLNEVSR